MAGIAETNILPISEISAYHSKWTIKAKVTSKSVIRTFGKDNGKVFSCDLSDSAGGEIRASFFNDGVTKYGDMLQIGKVFTFTNGRAKVANKQYNNTNHRYELTFDRETLIEEVTGETADYKTVFNVADLRSIQAKTLPCRADLCGVISQFGQVTSLTAKDGRELVKRDITLVDDTATSMVVTLWAEKAKLPDTKFEGKPLLAIKGVLVKEFNGERSASTAESSVLEFNPDLPEATRIGQWWLQGGSKQSFANFINLQDVQSKPAPCRIDLCGIISSFKERTNVTTKDGKELQKRDVTVADDTGVSMEVTLWGENGNRPDSEYEGNPTIVLTSILIKEFNGGRNGGTLASSTVSLRSDSAEAQRIQQWWSQGGSSQSLISLRGAGGGGAAANAEHVTVAEMRLRSESIIGDQAQLFKVVCRLNLVQTQKQGEQQPLHYCACAELRDMAYGKLPCNKRVDSSGFCASCDRQTKSVMRINARCRFSDAGDSVWLTTFHEAAEKVIGMSAEKVAEIDSGAGGREKLEEVLRQRYLSEPLELTVRAKMDSYNGEPRMNVTCVGAAPINRKQRGTKMLAEIQEMIAA